ncbi:Rrf2 family transcriptional regulator [Elizabethkingia argentiflava]|uniref:Rrf2 family transcriptional regulator n=1 Tax=Elizabethkingia argenteiflava TaxID=2681556 RepID=A0A845PYL3_9FLAO|nr:Rrf2 family transcriptional regulator [Elizabethkingia argenteiflava]NAW51906.1 Rrf2 family transcriptional regulator [Elizabethkingia argenteiflava]
MFSKTCEYAIRALIFIAQKTRGGNRVGIKDIAKGIDSPEYFIAKILQDLTKKGLVQSAKGPTGGFYLDQNDLNRSLADIVVKVDGERIFKGCAMGLRECSHTHPCPVHYEFKQIRNKLKEMLESSKIGEFVDKLDACEIFLKK